MKLYRKLKCGVETTLVPLTSELYIEKETLKWISKKLNCASGIYIDEDRQRLVVSGKKYRYTFKLWRNNK